LMTTRPSAPYQLVPKRGEAPSAPQHALVSFSRCSAP